MEGGGIGNTVLGTLVVVAISTARWPLPLGFMGAVFLAEYGGEIEACHAWSAFRPRCSRGC